MRERRGVASATWVQRIHRASLPRLVRFCQEASSLSNNMRWWAREDVQAFRQCLRKQTEPHRVPLPSENSVRAAAASTENFNLLIGCPPE